MVIREQYLVVVSILDGRRFPKRAKHQLVVETRFDGEFLATDPSEHTESPEFSTELAWELSKKALHQHRLQRTPIKLQCYAVDLVTGARENIGYVMLDLRTAAFQEETPAKVPVQSRWYPLLNTKYARLKPELRIGISLENDGQTQEESFKARPAPPRKGQVPENDEELDPKSLLPVLNDMEGYYQIGPVDQCTDMFVVSVTVGFAANLAQLVPSTMPLPARDGGFFFYFSLFGNDVTNEPFHDLLNPNFPAERASVRVRSSPEALRLYFSSQPGIQVHLCCGDKSLGSADISLTGLLKKENVHQLDSQPVALEGAFRLIPPTRTQQQLPPIPVDLAPVVGTSVALRREEVSFSVPSQVAAPSTQEVQRTEEKVQQPEIIPTTPSKEPAEKPTKLVHSPPEKLERPQEAASSPPDSMGGYTPVEEERGSTTDELSSLTQEDRREKRGKTHGDKVKDDVRPGPSHARDEVVRPKPKEDEPSSSLSQAVLAIDAATHHFCFSIDMRSIRDMDTPTAANIFLRYTYPFFGSSAPIMTHPPVEVRRHTEVLLPHSFCAFDFATPPQQLKETFLRIPLLIEVWHRDRMTQDVLLGIARLSLAKILNADKARVASKAEGSPEGWRQICSERALAESTDGKQQRVCELHVVLGLEDYGPINTREVIVSTEPSQSTTIEQKPQAEAPAEKDARETLEYKAAMELEMWKEAQEEMYEHQMKEKEVQHMKALAEEWKRRDKEREHLVRKKVDEYTRLEEQLRLAIADVEKRERQLAANEAEVMRLRTDLQRDYERKLSELKDALHRMNEDCLHQIELERSKVKDVEEQKQRLQEQQAAAEKKLEDKEKEFQVYREQINTKPEVRLQSEINLLTLEKVELERKLDSVTKSKIHYKQQWGRALKELARLKQKEQNEARARLKRQQQELEHMRLRYLAAEEKEVVKSEKKELEDIKGELNKFQQELQQQKQGSPQEAAGSEGQRAQWNEPDLDSSVDDHVARLIEERDTLLRTGVYTHHDRIITELDKQIREAITRRGK